MHNPDEYFRELKKTIFWVEKLKFFDADPGSGMEKIRIRDKHPRSATLCIRYGTVPCRRNPGVGRLPLL